jgi:hypothetical protein
MRAPIKPTTKVSSSGQAKSGQKIANSTLNFVSEIQELSTPMVIHECRQPVEVDTPQGRGRVWLVTEYGTEIEKVFTVVLAASGEIWEFSNRDIKATKNFTMGRGSWPK